MNDIRHFAIQADDIERARSFYSDVFGWSFEPWGPPGFYRIQTSEGALGGALQSRREWVAGQKTVGFECTIAVDDVDAVAEAVIAARDRGQSGQRYLLSGEDLEIGDLAARIEALTGVAAPKRRVPYWLALAAARVEDRIASFTKRPPKAPLTGVRLAGRRVRFDNSKARAALGFDPPPIDRALADAVSWLGTQ